MPTADMSDLIRKYFSAYEGRDRKALEDLLHDDFTFSSPHDPHIDRQTYFVKCWPNSQNIHAFHTEKLLEKGSEAFVLYECEPRVGANFRNAEYFRVEGSKIGEIQVFYGSLPTTA